MHLISDYFIPIEILFEFRQMLRQTWANTSEFNYSKFAALHAPMKGTYLPINYNDWKNVTVKNDNDDSDTGNYSTVSEMVFN